MNINRISSNPQQQTYTSFQGVRILPAAKDSIVSNLPEFYLGTRPVETIFQKLEATKIDFLKFLGIKKTKSLEPLSNLDIILHNVYVDPVTKEKFYLYSIPTIGKGLYSINTNKSILETPVSLCRDIIKQTHGAEVSYIAHR